MVKSFLIFTFKIPEMKVQLQPQFSPHCFVYWTPGQQGALPQVMAGNNKNIITTLAGRDGGHGHAGGDMSSPPCVCFHMKRRRV